MKAEDAENYTRFKYEEHPYTLSYAVAGANTYWFLISELTGALWKSPEGSLAPVDAFGGDKWLREFEPIS